eukprot:PhM_4_TR1518/c0_g1_i1/m.103051/K11254/H4; histone H4
MAKAVTTKTTHSKSAAAAAAAGHASTGVKRQKKNAGKSGSITTPVVRRLARRAGIKRLTSMIYDEVRKLFRDQLKAILSDALAYCDLRRATTVNVQDVVLAMRRHGQVVYGYQ